MNIPVTPVGEVQGLPTGAIPSVTAGSVANALKDEFAVTFGATLRQSQQQGDASLQKSDAKAFEDGKVPQAIPPSGTAGLATNGLRAIQGAGSVLSLQADSLKALHSNGAIGVQTSGADATASKDTAQNALADFEESSVVLRAVYENPKVYVSGAVTPTKITTEPGTKSTVSVAKPEGLAASNKATVPAKASSAILVASLKNSLTSNVLLEGIAKSDTTAQDLAKSLEFATDTALANGKGVVDVTLPNNQATAKELKYGLAAGIKVSEKAATITVALAETSTRAILEKNAASSVTAAKAETTKSSVKSGQDTALTGVLDAVKTTAADTAQASLNGSTLATAAVPLAPANTDTTAAPVSRTVINSAGTKPVWKSNGQYSVDPDAPVKANMSAGPPTVVGRTGATDSSDRTAATKSDTNFEAAAQAALPTTPKITTEAAGVTQMAYATPLPAASATNDLSSSAVDKSQRNVPTATSDAKPVVAAITANGPQQSTFDLSLKNTTQAVAPEVISPDARSAKPTHVTTQTPSKPIADQLVEARVVADGTDAAKATPDRPVFQESLQRLKQSSDDSAKPQSAQSETAGGVSATAAAPVGTASGHTPDRSSFAAPVVANSAVTTPATAPGLQTSVQAPASAPPHVAAGTTGPIVQESSTGVISSLETGRHSSAVTALPSEPYRTIAATPTALEVGVPDGTQGWLRIRAEVGDQGVVNASLAAGSNAGQEMLHRQLPALNEYLHSEQISVTTSVTDRVFAAAGSSLAGMAAGSNGASSDTSGRSTHQEATAENAMAMTAGNQGGGTPGNGGQRDPISALGAINSSDSARRYDSRTGVSEPIVAQTPRDGESGQWLNVRA